MPFPAQPSQHHYYPEQGNHNQQNARDYPEQAAVLIDFQQKQKRQQDSEQIKRSDILNFRVAVQIVPIHYLRSVRFLDGFQNRRAAAAAIAGNCRQAVSRFLMAVGTQVFRGGDHALIILIEFAVEFITFSINPHTQFQQFLYTGISDEAAKDDENAQDRDAGSRQAWNIHIHAAFLWKKEKGYKESRNDDCE